MVLLGIHPRHVKKPATRLGLFGVRYEMEARCMRGVTMINNQETNTLTSKEFHNRAEMYE